MNAMVSDPLDWTDVGAVTDVPLRGARRVPGPDGDIAIFRTGDAVYATDNLCTHGHARLCDGFVEGHEIECPLHQGRFDLRSGQPTCPPAIEALTTYPVRIDGGRVYLSLG